MGGDMREMRAREVLMSLLPDHMSYVPIGSPCGTGYALKAMLAYADERVAAAIRDTPNGQ